MANYTAGQMAGLKARWLGHKELMRRLALVIKEEKTWYQSETYEALAAQLGPLPEAVEPVELDLRGALLDEADLSGANLERADLSGANLEKADLAGANVEGVRHTTDEIFDRLRRWWFPRMLSCIPLVRRCNWQPAGITRFDQLDLTGVDFSKNALLKRYIEDYQFIQAFRNKNWACCWILYPLWKGTSDCGRSLSVWTLWAVSQITAFALLYACAFYPAKVPALIQDLLGWAIPQMDVDPAKYHKGFWTPFHYSLATFTTSSFYGDVQLRDGVALFWNSLEVVLGYLMLGGLISIFTNRLAQRA